MTFFSIEINGFVLSKLALYHCKIADHLRCQ